MADAGDGSQRVVKSVQRNPNGAVVVLTGEVDMHRAMDVRECLMGLLDEKIKTLIVDLKEVSFMDSTGLATLVEALQVSRRKKTALKLVAIQPRVQAILEISRLETLFEICDTQEEALA